MYLLIDDDLFIRETFCECVITLGQNNNREANETNAAKVKQMRKKSNRNGQSEETKRKIHYTRECRA